MWVAFGDIGAARTAAFPMVDSKAIPRSAVRAAPASGTPDASARALDAVMDRYARGEDAAFSELYRQGAPRVRGFLIRLSGDPALADDLTQEAFLRVHKARGNFQPGAAALPWFFAIARNAFLDHTRYAQVRRAVELSDGSTTPPEPEAAADTKGDEALIARQTLDLVRATLAKLPVLQREAFVLLRFEGMSVSEAAQVLGATEGAVKIRAFRAYEALRAALGKDEPQGKGGEGE
jgi:RNA polymerase sigma-70 factor, ECF subfamily